MSPRELIFRAVRYAFELRERWKIKRGWVPVGQESVGPRQSLFNVEIAELEGVLKPYVLNISRLSEISSGHLAFLGYPLLDFGSPINWRRDPVSGTEAPMSYGKHIDYRDIHCVGNIKIVWELGRHQHLVPLAIAYARTGNRAYRDSILEQIDGWIERNPYGVGIHWSSALEVSLRLVSWAVIHSILTIRDGVEGLFAASSKRNALGSSIFEQTWFIRNFLSQYSSANNHLIGELTGIIVTTTVFDLGRFGREWNEFARCQTELEAERQVFPDGVSKEQSFYYQLWVIEYLLLCWLAAQRDRRPLSDGFRDRIVRMAQFLNNVSRSGVSPPQVGDADDGVVVRFEASLPESPYAGTLAAVANVFPGTEFEVGRGTIPEKAIWYGLINQGKFSINSSELHRAEARLPRVYSHGGYALLGTRERLILFDAGSLGYLSIAAHGHADALSFCFSVNGKWWLVDPGTYAYHGDAMWRGYFRGTSAHNTVSVDGLDQSQSGGAFLWIRHAKGKLFRVQTDDNGGQCASGSHDGYKGIGIEHRRKLTICGPGNCVEVLDHLLGTGRHEFAIHFHFPPDVRISKMTAPDHWLCERQGESHNLRMIVDARWNWAVHHGNSILPSGWFSTKLGSKQPAPCLRGVLRDFAPCEIRTVIRVEPAS